MLVRRPGSDLCLDKACDAEEAECLLERSGYAGNIKRQGEKDELGVGEVVYPARVSWYKKAWNHRELWLLAAALIAYQGIVSV